MIKQFNSSTWVGASYKSYQTVTRTFASVPAAIRASGQNITSFTLKGALPPGATQSSPAVFVEGAGNKTANLLDYSFVTSTQFVTVTPITNGLNLTGTYYAEINITLEVGTTYYMSWVENVISGSAYVTWRLQYTDNTYSALTRPNVALTPEKEIAKVLFYVNSSGTQASVDITYIMLSTASLPYEPYGYKIPILSGANSYPIYLSSPLRKSFDGTVVDELSSTGTVTYRVDQYGDPLSTPVTEQVTVPTIATTSGLILIDTDTTVKPSEMTLTYPGWVCHVPKKYNSSN